MRAIILLATFLLERMEIYEGQAIQKDLHKLVTRSYVPLHLTLIHPSVSRPDALASLVECYQEYF